MKKLFISVGLFFALSTFVSAAEQVFYVGQSHEDWAFNVTGKGRALTGKSLITVRLDEIRIVNNPAHAKTKWIDYVEVGYGYRQPNGDWAVKSVGARKKVEDNFSPGEWMILYDVDATLSIKEKKPSKYWIVIVVGTSKKGTVYAHSRNDLFQ